MKKRLLSILLTACLLLGLLPTVALAEGNTGSAPSVWAYATQEQLKDDTFSPNYQGIPENIGKLIFGKNGTQWYILGGGKGGDYTIIFAASSMGNGNFTSSANIKSYDPTWGCSYPPGDTITKVYSNHYGASSIRESFTHPTLLGTDFSEAELRMLQDSTLSIYDTKNSTHYNITDKLYLLARLDNSTLIAGGLNDTNEYLETGIETDSIKLLARDVYWKTGDPFWLRTPCEASATDVIWSPDQNSYYAAPGAGVGKYPVTLDRDIRPATKLDLSSVLFAAAARAASSDSAACGKFGMDSNGEPPAMTLRLDGSSKNIGTVTYYSTGDIQATKGSTSGAVALVVQGNDGTNDWYYSKQITGTKTVNVSEIKSALGLSDIDLSKCKIWLETSEGGMIYAVGATETAASSISSVAITGIDTPSAGAAFDTTAACTTTGVSASPVTWTPSASAAAYGISYTASVTLTAATGYGFTDSTAATVNSYPATSVTKNANGTLTVTFEFPAIPD